jgi:hypothetical protein
MYNVTSTNTKEKGDWIRHVSLQPGYFVGIRTAQYMLK